MCRSVALLRNDFLPLLPESPALDLAYRLAAVLDEASAHARRLRSPQPPGINFQHLTHHCLALRNPSRPLPPGPVGRLTLQPLPDEPLQAPGFPAARDGLAHAHGDRPVTAVIRPLALGSFFLSLCPSSCVPFPSAGSATVPCKGWRRLSGQSLAAS